VPLDCEVRDRRSVAVQKEPCVVGPRRVHQELIGLDEGLKG
jgi:hypothetical protein